MERLDPLEPLVTPGLRQGRTAPGQKSIASQLRALACFPVRIHRPYWSNLTGRNIRPSLGAATRAEMRMLEATATGLDLSAPDPSLLHSFDPFT
jgi:hypothetical protein